MKKQSFVYVVRIVREDLSIHEFSVIRTSEKRALNYGKIVANKDAGEKGKAISIEVVLKREIAEEIAEYEQKVRELMDKISHKDGNMRSLYWSLSCHSSWLAVLYKYAK